MHALLAHIQVCMPVRIASLIGATRVCHRAHSYAIAISWSTACTHAGQIRSKKANIGVSKAIYGPVNYHVDRHASSAELAKLNMFIKACSLFQAHRAACLLCVGISMKPTHCIDI